MPEMLQLRLKLPWKVLAQSIFGKRPLYHAYLHEMSCLRTELYDPG